MAKFDANKHMVVPKKANSVLHRTSGYADNCSDGFNKSGYSNAHHILSCTCISSRVDDYKKADADYIEDCLKCCSWDINASGNLVGLPLNSAYINYSGQSVTAIATWNSFCMWPSHQVDHNTANGYTRNVRDWLIDNVWNTITKKEHVHKVDVKDIEGLLNDGSSHWKGQLKARATRNSGTTYSWENRHKASEKTKWYKPFSMAIQATPRCPGKGPKGLTDIFSQL